MRTYYRHLKVFLIVLLFAIMLTPSMTLTSRAPNIRVEELVIGALFAYLLLISLAGQRIEFAWGLRQTMLLAFPLFLFVSIAVGILLGYSAQLGDLNQLLRIAKYLVIYTVAVSVVALSPEPERTRTSITNWTLVFACLLALLTIQQYFDLFALNARYLPYLEEGHARRLVQRGYGRPVGMVGNPNALGFLLAVSAIVALYRILLEFRLFYLITLGLTFVALLMTGSRGALIAGLIGCLVVGILLASSRLPAKGRFVQRAAAVMAALALLAVIGSFSNTYSRLLDRFETLAASGTDDASWQERLGRWQENIGLFRASPAFGVGPLRHATDLEYGAVPDNEWWLLLRSYGLAGTLFLIATFLAPHLYRGAGRTVVLAIALYVASALYMVPAVVFHSLALMPLVLILIALSDGTTRLKRLA